LPVARKLSLFFEEAEAADSVVHRVGLGVRHATINRDEVCGPTGCDPGEGGSALHETRRDMRSDDPLAPQPKPMGHLHRPQLPHCAGDEEDVLKRSQIFLPKDCFVGRLG
jgi:hypothetical protein